MTREEVELAVGDFVRQHQDAAVDDMADMLLAWSTHLGVAMAGKKAAAHVLYGLAMHLAAEDAADESAQMLAAALAKVRH